MQSIRAYLLEHAGDVIHVHHQVIVLGDLARDLNNGRLLEAVRAYHLPGHLQGIIFCQLIDCVTAMVDKVSQRA